MSRAFEYWQYQQLEPNDRIIVGNGKRHSDWRPLVAVSDPEVELTEDEDNRLQDEYLDRCDKRINGKKDNV